MRQRATLDAQLALSPSFPLSLFLSLSLSLSFSLSSFLLRRPMVGRSSAHAVHAARIAAHLKKTQHAASFFGAPLTHSRSSHLSARVAPIGAPSRHASHPREPAHNGPSVFQSIREIMSNMLQVGRAKVVLGLIIMALLVAILVVTLLILHEAQPIVANAGNIVSDLRVVTSNAGPAFLSNAPTVSQIANQTSDLVGLLATIARHPTMTIRLGDG